MALTGIYDSAWNADTTFTDGSPLTTEFLNSILSTLGNIGGTVSTTGALPSPASLNNGDWYLVIGGVGESVQLAVVKDGVWDYIPLNVGTVSGTVAAGNDSRFPTSDQKAALAGTSGAPSTSNKYVTNADSRLSNARTPTPHASTHGPLGSDPLTLETLDAAPATHYHAASDLVSGTVTVARGGTGLSSYTVGNYLVATGATTLGQQTPAQLRTAIGAQVAGSYISNVVDDTTPTLGGNLDGAGKVVSDIELKDYSETVVITNTAADANLSLASGNVHKVIVSGNCVLSFTNPPPSNKVGSVTVILIRGSSGLNVSFGGTILWAGGFAPNLDGKPSGAIDVFTFMTVDNGATWYGFVSGENFS